jgi:hypothetical protein
VNNIRIKRITVAALFILSISHASAQMHVIKGELEGTYYGWTGKLVGTQITEFTINIGEYRWLLRSEYSTNWFWLAGGDGTNTYSVLVDPKVHNMVAVGYVFSGDFPQEALDTVSIPWLSFCSSHFLSHSTNRDSIPSLWGQPRTDPMSYVCSTEITQFTKPPYLPEKIKWVTSPTQIAFATSNSYLRIEDATVEELNKRSVDFQASISAGKSLGNYRVLDVTNVDGLILPLKFELDAYGYLSPEAIKTAQHILNEQSETNDLKGKIVKDTYLTAVYKGTVTKISIDSNHVELPEPKIPMFLMDHRLSSRSDGIDYVAYKSKQWKPQVDTELLNLLEIKKKHPPHNLSPSKPIGMHMQNVVRVLVLFICFAPLFVWGVRKLKNKTTKNTNK